MIQKVTQAIFLSKIANNFLPWKTSSPEIRAISEFFKIIPKKTIAQLAKIRPIWSP
jgi:hypothetical protein